MSKQDKSVDSFKNQDSQCSEFIKSIYTQKSKDQKVTIQSNSSKQQLSGEPLSENDNINSFDEQIKQTIQINAQNSANQPLVNTPEQNYNGQNQLKSKQLVQVKKALLESFNCSQQQSQENPKNSNQNYNNSNISYVPQNSQQSSSRSNNGQYSNNLYAPATLKFLYNDNFYNQQQKPSNYPKHNQTFHQRVQSRESFNSQDTNGIHQKGSRKTTYGSYKTTPRQQRKSQRKMVNQSINFIPQQMWSNSQSSHSQNNSVQQRNQRQQNQYQQPQKYYHANQRRGGYPIQRYGNYQNQSFNQNQTFDQPMYQNNLQQQNYGPQNQHNLSYQEYNNSNINKSYDQSEFSPFQYRTQQRKIKKKPKTNSGDISKYKVVKNKINLNRVQQVGFTTLMMSNIPCKITEEQMKKYFVDSGLTDYDFFRLPIDQVNKCNKGIGFINLTSVNAIKPFYNKFHNFLWKDNFENCNSPKICILSYADVQGTEKNEKLQSKIKNKKKSKIKLNQKNRKTFSQKQNLFSKDFGDFGYLKNIIEKQKQEEEER